jgi:starch synthase
MAMRICMLCAEFAPLAKIGGLADVVAGLSRHLAEIGQDVRVFMPRYRTLDERGVEIRPVEFLRDVTVALGPNRIPFSLLTARPPGREDWIYLIDCPSLYHRAGPYTWDADEYMRFAYLAAAALTSCQHMGWSPQILHVNDWHTALAPIYLRTLFGWDDLFAPTKTVLTIHNLGYQGTFGRGIIDGIGLGDYESSLHNEDLERGEVNFLKTGIIYADRITTVSRTYAEEIQTEAMGMGLDHELRARRDRLRGIVNGVDYAEWDPATDRRIPHRFDAGDLEGKRANTRVLLETLGLPPAGGAPVIGIVSRLASQKGFDILREPMPQLLSSRDMRLVALGSGDKHDEDWFIWLQRAFPDKVCFWHGYNEDLAHLIQAGSDLFLMPSRTEPCGLTQLYSMRYGTAPVVHKTGGLADTVEHFDPATGSGTGFVFDHHDPGGVRWALETALDLFPDRTSWERLMRNAMARDFSWERQGRQYLELYAGLV